MSYLLDAAREGQEILEQARIERDHAIAKAKIMGKHSLAEIAKATGLSKMRISQIVSRAREENDE